MRGARLSLSLSLSRFRDARKRENNHRVAGLENFEELCHRRISRVFFRLMINDGKVAASRERRLSREARKFKFDGIKFGA